MICGLKPYSYYKNTGLDWLDKIPEHWNWLLLSQVCKEQQVINSDSTKNNVLSLSHGNIIRKKNIDFGLVPIDYQNYQTVKKGDIILRLTDLQNDKRSLRTGLVKETGIITSAYVCLATTNTGNHPSFVHYVLHAFDTIKLFYGMGGGVRQSIGFNDIRRMRLPIPPASEQTAIVKYLDFTIAKINKVIQVKKRLILELKNQKQAMIDEAITKGIDPTVKMRPSGVKWLGEIPEHWIVTRGKYLFRETDVRSESDDYELLTVSHITGITPRSEKNVTMFQAESTIGYKRCFPNWIAINTMWAWMGALGVSKHFGVISPSYHTYSKIKDDSFSADYLDNLLRHPAYVSLYRVASTGIRSSRLRLYPDKFLNILFIRPPLDEQYKIERYIASESTKIDAVISRYEKEIELVTEYRASLIFEVVMGKVDVRDMQVEDVTDGELFIPDESTPDELDIEDVQLCEECEV